MNITDIILLIIVSLFIYHYISRNLLEGSQKKTTPQEKDIQEKNSSDEKTKVVIPVINVIFQGEIEEDEIVGEIADMYLEGRTFYYNGIQPPGQSDENEDIPYIKFKDVNWEILKTIEV